MKYLFTDADARKQTTTFLICLAVSTIIWFIVKLSHEYTGEFQVPVVYNNCPENVSVIDKKDSLVKLKVRASGFSLLGISFGKYNQGLSVDLKRRIEDLEKDKHILSLSTKSLYHQLSGQLEAATELVSIEPDSLRIVLEKRVRKLVPVKSQLQFQLESDKLIYGDLKIQPKKVWVSGPQYLIDTLQYVCISSQIVKDVKEDFVKQFSLQKPAKQIKLEQNQVMVSAEVETFTESALSVAVGNQIEQKTIRSFPESIEVSYVVALKDFKKIKSDSFRVKLEKIEGSEKARVIIAAFPKEVTILDFHPRNVEYIFINND